MQKSSEGGNKEWKFYCISYQPTELGLWLYSAQKRKNSKEIALEKSTLKNPLDVA